MGNVSLAVLMGTKMKHKHLFLKLCLSFTFDEVDGKKLFQTKSISCLALKNNLLAFQGYFPWILN